MRRYFHLFLFFVFGFILHVEAQNKTLPQITPLSPNAAAFDKYVDVPVSLASGRINLSIPLYEINVGSVKIPIGLSYNNNGLMPDEIPTWVGHGWTLNTGGVITYHQRGLNDFAPSVGLFAQGKARVDSFLAGHMNSFQTQTFLEDVIAGNVDAEYDTYNYSFPGGSGSFYFADSTTAQLNPKADVKVEKTTSGFKLTDDDGNQFYFEAEEFTSTVNSASVSPDFSDNSSFYLSKIVARNGSIATFKYTQYFFQYTRTSESIFHMTSRPNSDCPSSDIISNDALTRIYYLLPDSIIFQGGYIKFNLSGSYRADLNAIESGCNIPYLQSFSVYNYQGEKIKDFNFSDSYFGTNARLRLDSLQETNNSTPGRKWKFSYYGNGGAGNIFGTNKDHWGYANAGGGGSGIPDADYNSFISNWQNYSVTYSDKSSDFSYAVQGMIKTVIYPTGGTSTFEYEPNQFRIDSLTHYDFGNFLKLPTSYDIFNNHLIDHSEITGGTYTGSFTVPETGYYMINSYKQLSPDPFYDNADITFTGPSSTDLYNATNHCGPSDCTTGSKIIQLTAGSYTYTVKGSYYSNSFGTYYLAANFNLYSPISPISYPVGGCRISKITFNDSTANKAIIKKFIYDDTLPDISFKQIPNYVTSVEQGYLVPPTFCHDCGSSYTIHDQSVVPLVGNVIEYSTVTELQDSSGSLGKKVNHFLLSDNIAGATSDPATPAVNTSWRTGNILEQDLYSNSGTLVAKNESKYATDYSGTQINGIKASYSTYCVASSGRTYSTNLSTLFSESFRKTQDTSFMYAGSSSLSQPDSLYYNLTKHNQSTGFKKDNSDNTTTLKKIIYVFDYDSLSGASSTDATALKKLSEKHINAPIEEVDIQIIGGTQYVVGGILRTYKVDTSAINKIYALKIASPIAVSSFLFSHVTSSGVFQYDSRYILKVVFDSYDTSLNVLQDHLDNNQKQSYIWDYKLQYPIAEIKNSDVNSIAYTSFEGDGKGNWTYSGSVSSDATSPTGKKCYNLSGGNITKSGLTSNTYIVSYWGKSGSATVNSVSPTRTGRSFGSWTYYEHEVTGTSITLSGSVYVDEVRVYPKGALMTTYTYEPLIGMTSQCDPNNRITYYQYDNLNRLSLVRDQDYNILKKICYNYAGQPEDCGMIFFNAAKSGNYTRNNCSSGYAGTTVAYTVAANTYSSTVSQVDADTQAQNDVNTNGQSYANSHGSCLLIYYNVAKSGNFTRNNCGSGYSGSTVTYTVAANTYNSTISQAYIDSVAQADVNANGQAYANTHGTCQLNDVSVYGENDRGGSITIQLHNVSSGVDYYIYVGGHDSNSGNVPPGTYNITISPDSPSGWYNYSVGCGYYDDGPGAITFYNISIDDSCNQIYID